MSDATQKLMEHDRSSVATTDDQLRCGCPAGKTCHLIDFIDTAYKPHYRGQFNSIQFKFICIALFTIQSLQSALQEIKFLQYIYTL